MLLGNSPETGLTGELQGKRLSMNDKSKFMGESHSAGLLMSKL